MNKAPSFDTSSVSKRFGPGLSSVEFNPLNPNIHKQILQTGLHTFR